MSWLKGPWKATNLAKVAKFGKTLSKGLTKANELAQRAPWKVANLAKAVNLAKMVNLAKICQRV